MNLATDTNFMRQAIAIASRAVGLTAPNPPVGCVIVKNGVILSSAHTAKSGRPHAETMAISEAGSAANGACAYVTLEPCAHHGQTPPCAEAIINAGINRVVVASTDPSAKVNGQGIKMLQNAGIVVETGVCAAEAQFLNEGFFSVQQQGRPFVTLKTATSLDGKIALKNGESQWITGEESRAYVHLLRARSDAIITGIATIMADNPELTCRLPGMETYSPVRVVLDTGLRLPIDCKLVKSAQQFPCWVATLPETIANQADKVKQVEQSGVRLLAVGKAANGKICLEDTMQQLAKCGITSVLIEAGTSINSAALGLGLVDRIAWFQAPIIIGNEAMAAFSSMPIEKIAAASKLKLTSYKIFGNDVLRIFEV